MALLIWHAALGWPTSIGIGVILLSWVLLFGSATVKAYGKTVEENKTLKLNQRPPLDAPNLKVNWGGVIVGQIFLSDDGIWISSVSPASSSAAKLPYLSLRLQVSNPHIDGKKVGAAKDVSARVEFTYNTGIPGWIAAPTAWLNEEVGKLTIDLDYTKELIVAVRTGKQWNMVTNVRRSNGLPPNTTAMEFHDAPWHDATLKVSVMHDGEAKTQEYDWNDIDETIIPRIRPVTLLS